MTPYASGRGWTLYRGEAIDLLRGLDRGQLDAVITDPPYSSGGFTRADRSGDPEQKYARAGSWQASQLTSFAGDSRDQRAFHLWCALWVGISIRACKPGAIFGAFTDWRQLPTLCDALQIGGVVWRGVGNWVKTTARPQKGRIAAGAEYLVWGSVGSMKVEGNGVCAPGTVWAEPTCYADTVRGDDRKHLTQKPEEVMRWALSIVATGGLVLDPFAGLGSTGVAALQTGRRFIGLEQEEAHLETAARRLIGAEQVEEAQMFRAAPEQPKLVKEYR